MSADRGLESRDTDAQDAPSPLDAARESGQIRGHVGDPIPDTLTDSELAARLALSLSTFYRSKRRGDFRFLELDPQLPGHTRYSGTKLARWFTGEPVAAASGRTFFNQGRPKGRTKQVVGVAMVAHDRSVIR